MEAKTNKPITREGLETVFSTAQENARLRAEIKALKERLIVNELQIEIEHGRIWIW